MQSRLPLSVAVITLNEEKHLSRCLASVRELASEIVVLDSGSRDRTGEIAQRCGAIFAFEPWQGHVAQKNLALRRCTQSWVLCLDADEALSPELADSIRKLFAGGEPSESGFSLNRRTFYLGAWIWHAWYPEWRLRLVRKDRAAWRGHDPHDRLEVAGATNRLAGDLLHYSYRNLEDHLSRTVRYARISAEAAQKTGEVLRWYQLVFSPWLTFLKKLIFKSAWRDGWRGWIISVVTLFSVFVKYAFRLEMKLISQPPPANHASVSGQPDSYPTEL